MRKLLLTGLRVRGRPVVSQATQACRTAEVDVPDVSMSKAEVVSDQLEDRYGVTLRQWVDHKRERGASWVQMESDLHDALGWTRRPMSREGLRLWSERHQGKG